MWIYGRAGRRWNAGRRNVELGERGWRRGGGRYLSRLY